MRYWIGIDMGTTATKAVLYTEKGQVIKTHSSGYELHRDATGMAEEAPQDIFDAVISCIRQVAKTVTEQDDLCAIGFSAQQHALMLATPDFQPLTRLITWADTRARRAADVIRQLPQGHEFFLRTGTPIQPMSPLAKLYWLKQTQPELFDNQPIIMDIKTYLFNRLFGNFKIDLSLASATGLYHLKDQKWDSEILDFLGLEASQLPEIVSPYEVEEQLSASLAAQMGIPANTPFVWGGADGPMSNLGAGATHPGLAALSIGTSGAVRVMTRQPLVDTQARTFTYALDENHWVVGGATNSGGAVLAWLQHAVFADELSLNELTTLAEKVPAGSRGLIFHPYLGGERAPIWDARATGSFFGLSFEHGRGEMMRAVLEGIGYNLHTILNALSEVVGEIDSIQATGGFTQSNLWPQILSDIFELPIQIGSQQEAGCLAAVIMSQKAVGKLAELADFDGQIVVDANYSPDQMHQSMYRSLQVIYDGLMADYQKFYAQIDTLKCK